jgi:hypothetical protein
MLYLKRFSDTGEHEGFVASKNHKVVAYTATSTLFTTSVEYQLAAVLVHMYVELGFDTRCFILIKFFFYIKFFMLYFSIVGSFPVGMTCFLAIMWHTLDAAMVIGTTSTMTRYVNVFFCLFFF